MGMRIKNKREKEREREREREKKERTWSGARRRSRARRAHRSHRSLQCALTTRSIVLGGPRTVMAVFMLKSRVMEPLNSSLRVAEPELTPKISSSDLSAQLATWQYGFGPQSDAI